MNTLLLQQQCLLDALFARPGSRQAADAEHQLNALLELPVARGLMAVKANGHALAERCLLAAYPVISQVIGAESFQALARDLWHGHPPVGGDLARWGDALPAFLDHNEQLGDLPWLGDVARVEWALHRAAGAADAPTDLTSFARLTREDPQWLTLRLAPGTVVVASAWPVTSLIHAHTEGQPGMAEVGRRLQARISETAVVWRQGWRSRVAECPAAAAGVIQALLTGTALPQALERAGSTFDFSDWLTAAVHSGLVIGVCSALLEPPPRLDTP